MGNHRIERLSGEIKRELAGILEREMRDPRLGMISVVSVELAPDGSTAKIYVSPVTVGMDQQAIAAALDSGKGYIRRELSKRLNTRSVPELHFQVDDSIAYGVRMTRVIDAQIAADEKAAAGRPPEEEGKYRD